MTRRRVGSGTDNAAPGGERSAPPQRTMATQAGFAAYRDPRINGMRRKILNAWAEFLNSAESLSALNGSSTGWTSAEAQRAVGMDQYEHDPDDGHWGFASWNGFFTRRFKEGQRPVASPDDDKVIVSACESTPYRISTDVQRRDSFWPTTQPYSLVDMLAFRPVGHRDISALVAQHIPVRFEVEVEVEEHSEEQVQQWAKDPPDIDLGTYFHDFAASQQPWAPAG